MKMHDGKQNQFTVFQFVWKETIVEGHVGGHNLVIRCNMLNPFPAFRKFFFATIAPNGAVK